MNCGCLLKVALIFWRWRADSYSGASSQRQDHIIRRTCRHLPFCSRQGPTLVL